MEQIREGETTSPSGKTGFQVIPLTTCPHLVGIEPVTADDEAKFDVRKPCETCEDASENWICLTCHQVHCSRYVLNHMMHHSAMTAHQMCLSYSDLSVWCYECESYVHNEVMIQAKKFAHRSKFGQDHF